MKTKSIQVIVSLLFLVLINPAFALSRRIGRDIEFPKGYDQDKASAIRNVIGDNRFHFVDGVVSYWPPEISTRLSFQGDANSLNEFFSALRALPGIGLRLALYRGRNDELRRDSAWQLDFNQARPDELAVYLNLNSEELDFAKIKLPEWPPAQGGGLQNHPKDQAPAR